MFLSFSKPIECTPLRMNPNINHGFWVIIMCQSMYINRDQCILVGDIDSEGGFRHGVGDICEISTSSAQFCCESKSALADSLLKYVVRTTHKLQFESSYPSVIRIGAVKVP